MTDRDATVPQNRNDGPENRNDSPPATRLKKPGLRGNRNNPNLAELGKLFRWQKGQGSPNPGGRPKTQPFTDALREIVALVDPQDGLTFAEKITLVQVLRALEGSLPHFHEIMNRVEGPPTQTIDYGPLQGVMEAEPGPPRVQELIKRVAAVMVERSTAYDLELPDFIQDVAAEMEAEAAAESGDDGKPSQKAMMFGDGMSQRDGFVATISR